MLRSEWLSMRIANGLDACLLEMTASDRNSVYGTILAYFFGLINPHVSNRFFIREIFNVVAGVLVLSSIYRIRNFVLVLLGVPINLFLLYLPIKNRQIRTKMVLVVNLLYILIGYVVCDKLDTSPVLTLTAFFIKYVYSSMEYTPVSMGFMSYIGYVFFIAGIRYGPVMSYSAYDAWINRGYMYPLETGDKKEIERFIGDTKSEKEKEEKKEDYIMHIYSKMITKSVGNFIIALLYLIVYRKVIKTIEASVQEMGIFNERFIITVIDCVLKLFYICALWLSEEGIYQIGFVENMKNIEIGKFFAFWKSPNLFSLWNVQGHKFTKRVAAHLTEEDKKEDDQNIKIPQNTTEQPKSFELFDIKDHISQSFVEYGHLLVFPLHLGSFLISTVSIFIMGFIQDTKYTVKDHSIYATAVLFGKWLFSIYIFIYYMITLVEGVVNVLYIWRHLLASGHLLPLIQIIDRFHKRKQSSEKQKEISISTE